MLKDEKEEVDQKKKVDRVCEDRDARKGSECRNGG